MTAARTAPGGPPRAWTAELRLRGESGTEALARRLAAAIRPGDAIGLSGDLGAGKTHFARAFVRALAGPAVEVPSPTFTLVQTYDAAEPAAPLEIRHVDLYRIADPGELLELGLEDGSAEAVTLVEWPERAPGVVPPGGLEIRLSFCDNPSDRLAALRGGADWAGRIGDAAGTGGGAAMARALEKDGADAREADRRRLLRRFLARNGLDGAPVAPLADDCSFRRYFRVARDGRPLVVMDAPPDLEETAPFARMSRLLNGYGYSAPRVLDCDAGGGFLLLDDFGDATYTRALAAGADERALYARATDLLADLHRRPPPGPGAGVPPYSDAMLLDEAVLFVDWYLERGLGMALPAGARDGYLDAWRRCLPALRAAPEALVLRDYHVDNLMALEGRDGIAGCGLLDFQDATVGPASYDLVSLLQDSRRDLADGLEAEMLERYFAAAGPAGRGAFMLSYLGLGAQRALKVFGIFARQSALYGNHQYLAHIPRLWRHAEADLRPEEFAPVRDWIDRHVPCALRATPRDGGGGPRPCS